MVVLKQIHSLNVFNENIQYFMSWLYSLCNAFTLSNTMHLFVYTLNVICILSSMMSISANY